MLLLLVMACAPVDAGLGPAGHASTWAEVACPALPTSLELATPAPWIEDAAPAYTRFAEALPETAYWAHRGGRVDTSIGDLAVHDGRLILGLGDWEYKTGSLYCPAEGGLCPREDAPGHGLPLLALSPGAGEARSLGVLREEELRRLRRTGLGVLLPSTDPTRGDGRPACAELEPEPGCPEEAAREQRSFRVGNSTQLRADGLRVDAVIPDASHVFDVVPMDGTLWAIGSGLPITPPDLGGTFAMLWRSEDDGRTWRAAWRDDNQPGRRRLLSALPVGETVLIFGLHRVGVEDRPLRHRLDGGAVTVAPELAPALAGWVETAVLDAHRGVAWSGGQVRAIEADEAAGITTWDPELSEYGAVVDTWLLCAGDLLLLTRRRDGGRWRYTVLRTRDLEGFAPVLQWSSSDQLTALAWWDGGLVFGGEGHGLWRADAVD